MKINPPRPDEELKDARAEIERLQEHSKARETAYNLLTGACDNYRAEIERLQAAFKFITDWHEAKWRNRLNPQHARDAHKESWQRCLAKAEEVRGE